MSTMEEEIRQQPAALERTIQEEWPQAATLRLHLAKNPVHSIVLTARGTSDNAAQFGRYLLEITTGIPVSLAAPSVRTLYRAELKLQNTAVIAISQSGESTDTNLVLEHARNQGAFTIGITNESESTLAKLAHHTFLVRAGKEKSVAATKTYTGQLACMYLLAHSFGGGFQETQLQRLPEYADAALNVADQVTVLAERYRFMRHAVCIGRGLNYSNSFELALKLMETCYVVAERFSSADLLHGPIAMLEDSFPAFVFGPPGVTWPSIHELTAKLASLRAETLLITDQSNPAASTAARKIVLPLSLMEEEHLLPQDVWTPIPYIIPAQLLAANLAQVKGLNPDRPRTLSKVTKTI